MKFNLDRIYVFIIGIVLIALVGLGILWSLNVLEIINVGISFKNWLAVLVLITIFYILKSVERSR